MPITKLQKKQDRRKSVKVYVKTAYKECGYTAESFAARLGISRPTLDSKLEKPEELTVAMINKICQILPIEEGYERILRGYKS